MEPLDDPFTPDQYSQLEKFLMGESKEFRLPELPESNPAQVNNATPLQGPPGEDARRTANNGVTTSHQWSASSSENNGPPGFSSPMGQGRLCSGNSGSSLNSYLVQAPSSIQPVQWSSPAQTSSVAQPAPVSASTLLAQYSNPTQPAANNIPSGLQTSNSATTQQAQRSNLPPAPCNNALQAPANNSVTSSSNEGQRGALYQTVATEHAGSPSSSIASRFAAAAHGASQGSPTAHPSHFMSTPVGFMTFSRPNSADLSFQNNAYKHGAQMDGSGYGYGTQFFPQATVPGGGAEAAVLPMYSSSTFHDLALMAQRNNNLARQKPQEAVPAVKNRRGRPRGSRKRQPQPRWEEAEYELQEAAQHVRKPYHVRRAEWNDLKLSGGVPGRGQVSPSPGEMAFDGGQGWEYSRMNPNNQGMLNPISSIQNLSRIENMAIEVPAVGANLIHHQPATQPSSDQMLLPDENPSKFWRFGSDPSSTTPLPSKKANKTSSAAEVSKGKQPVEDDSWLQSGSAMCGVPVPAKSCMEFGTGSSSNDQNMGGITNSGSYESNIDQAAANNQIWRGHSSTYIDFENVCFGVPPSSTKVPQIYGDASASGSNCSNKKALGISAQTNNPSNNQVSDQFPISINDYLIDYEQMQLTDEDYIACALREAFQGPQASNNVVQPNDKPATLCSPHQAATFTTPAQLMQSEQVSTLGVFQTNSSQQLTQQANSTVKDSISGSNSQPSMVPQPFHNSSAHYNVQDGSSSVHQTYMQNNTFDPAAHQGSSSQVPASSHQATRPQNILSNLGPTAYYYYQQQQQANAFSANGPRPYTMPPTPVQHHQAAGPVMQQQYYQYGRPSRAPRRRRQNPLPAPRSVMDFNQCAITPAMFNDMVHNGSADSILGSALWPGLHQDVFNMMVMADPTLLDPGRLQESVTQINSGMLPIPNLLHSTRMNPNQAGFSAPPAANRMMGSSSNMMNYGTPPRMQPNPTPQQGLGVVAADDANYNTAHLNAINIPSVQNQQLRNLQGGEMINTNMQQEQPNFGNWHEYPAPSSSLRSEEIQQPVPVNSSSIPENETHNTPFSSSMTSPASVIPPPQYEAPPNPQSNQNTVYNPMSGVPYAPRGPHM